MSDRFKRIKKLSLAVSYIAFLSTQNAFAVDKETQQAQEEQFDIFDVEEKKLDQIAEAQAEDSSNVNDPSNVDEVFPIPTLDENDFEFEDDLFVDTTNELGDIPKANPAAKSEENNDSEKQEATNTEETGEADEIAEESIASESIDEMEEDNIKIDDEGYVYNTDLEGTLEIEEEEEFKRLLLESAAERDSQEQLDSDNNIVEDSAIEENIAEDTEINPIDDLFSDIETQMDDTNVYEEEFSIDGGSQVDQIESSRTNNAQNDGLEYKELKKHLSRFLLSFAGEGQESQSKAYELHNTDTAEDKPTNDIFDTGSSSDGIDIPEFTQNDMFPNEEEESDIVDPINNAQEDFDMGDDIYEQELPEANEQDETNLEIVEDESDLEMQKTIDIDSEIANDKLNEDPDSFDELFNQEEDSESPENIAKKDSEDEEDEIDRMMSAYNEEEEEDQSQLNNEELEKQNQQQLIGSCNNLPNKIMSCQSFDCKMPNPLSQNEEITISILQSDNKCNFTYENKPLPELKCNLSADDKTELSASFSTFFETTKNNDFSIIDNYVSDCNEKRLAKIKKEQDKAKKLAEQKKKQEEFELNKDDKAYFEMLNKKRQALPKDKQLPNSVIETIEKVTPSIAEKKENFDKKPELKNIKVSHGERGTAPSNDEGLIRSNSGMDISMSNNSSKANEIKLTMQKAYRALLAGQTSAAVVLYNKVLNVESDNMDALFGLATAYHKNYQYELARDTYAKILRIEPDNKEVLNNFLVLVAEESPESALIELQKLERINSNFSPIPAQIAMIYLKLGQPEAAERYLRRAVVLSPDNITYKYNLAITSDKLNKHYQAINLYKQVLEAAKNGAIIPGSVSSISSRMDYLEGKISSMN